jgi:hypothetical protein
VTGALSLCPNEADCGSILGRVDAIEAFNAKSSWHENKLSLELAGRMQMPVTAGSDAHRVTEIGSGIMRAPSDFRDGGLGTVSGVDQTSTALQIRRRSREQLRGHALFLKRAIPEPVWRAGKRAWTTWLDHVDAGVPMPMREYGSFPSVIRAPVQQEHIHSTSGEHQ